jgi:hypothetical protein
MENTPGTDPKPGVSKVKLAVGAASLFLFIVGLKRSFRMDESPQGARLSDDGEEPRG